MVLLGLLSSAIALSLVSHEGGTGNSPQKSPITIEALIPHAVIVIDNDDSFRAAALSEGWPGDGSSSTPYIVNGYEINAAGHREGIHIGNTTLYFEIGDCYIYGGTETGILMLNVTNGRLSNNNCSSNAWNGILLFGSSANTIVNNTCWNNVYGIRLWSSAGNAVSNCTCLGNGEGIYLSSSNSNVLDNNTLRLNTVLGIGTGNGILLQGSSGNRISNCTLDSNLGRGVRIESASNLNVVEGCNGTYDDLFVSDSSHETISRNSLNFGGMLILYSSWNMIDNNTCTDTSISFSNSVNGVINMYLSDNNTLTNNTCANGPAMGGMIQTPTMGILLAESDNNTLSYNKCTLNEGGGICSIDSDYNTIVWNNCSNNVRGVSGIMGARGDGINAGGNHNIVSNNTCSFNYRFGLGVESSDIVSDNTLVSNGNAGIIGGATMRNNEIIGGGIITMGEPADIDTTNTANGLPIYYCRDWIGGTVPLGAGQVILDGCTGTTVKDEVLVNVSISIQLYSSQNCIVTNNTCADNNGAGLTLFMGFGIFLESSVGNSIFKNSILHNSYFGVYAGDSCDGNWIYNNSFQGNNGATTVFDQYHAQAFSISYDNWWNTTSGWGNYWSDWSTPDSNYDGIVDVPYAYYGVTDHYPLATPPAPIPEFGSLMPFVVMVLMAGIVLAAETRRGSRP